MSARWSTVIVGRPERRTGCLWGDLQGGLRQEGRARVLHDQQRARRRHQAGEPQAAGGGVGGGGRHRQAGEGASWPRPTQGRQDRAGGRARGHGGHRRRWAPTTAGLWRRPLASCVNPPLGRTTGRALQCGKGSGCGDEHRRSFQPAAQAATDHLRRHLQGGRPQAGGAARDPGNAPRVGPLGERGLPIIEKAVAELKALHVPQPDKATYDEFLTANDRKLARDPRRAATSRNGTPRGAWPSRVPARTAAGRRLPSGSTPSTSDVPVGTRGNREIRRPGGQVDHRLLGLAITLAISSPTNSSRSSRASRRASTR